MAPKVAIIYYSVWGHIRVLADAAKRGVESAGGTADLFQIPELLPKSILDLFSAPEKDPNVPVVTPEDLSDYDAFIFGVPTRFGNNPAQWVSFWERTGPLWKSGALWGKPAGMFVSCTIKASGMETTVANWLPLFAYHGMIFAPLGPRANYLLSDLEDTSGGSLWGSGTYCAGDHSRWASSDEIKLSELQGREMWSLIAPDVTEEI